MIRIPDTHNPYTRRQMKIAIPCCQYFSNLSIVSFLVCCLQGHVIDSNHGSWFSNLQGWDQIVQHWPHTVAHVLVNTVPVDMARGWKGLEHVWEVMAVPKWGIPMGYLKMVILGALSIVCIVINKLFRCFQNQSGNPMTMAFGEAFSSSLTVTTVTTARLDLMASNCWWSFQLSAAVGRSGT